MPLGLKIDRELEFRNKTHKWNVSGPVQLRKRHYQDLFDGITLDTTNRWATAGQGTIAISETQGGSVLVTTGATDNDSGMIASPIIFTADFLAIVEWDITITDVSGTALFVGFSDAKSESNNAIAIHYLDDSLTGDATDAVGFVIDADHATSSIMCEGVKNGSRITSVDTAIDWADGQRKKLRVELDADGGAIFYVDGIAYGYAANAVTDSTLLCCTVQAMTRANDGANTVRIRRFDAWQDD